MRLVTAEQERIRVSHPRCPYCHDQVLGDEPKLACLECMAWHHLACFEEHGVCSACGEEREQVASAPSGTRLQCHTRGCPQPGDVSLLGISCCLEHALRNARGTRFMGLLFVLVGVAFPVGLALAGANLRELLGAGLGGLCIFMMGVATFFASHAWRTRLAEARSSDTSEGK